MKTTQRWASQIAHLSRSVGPVLVGAALLGTLAGCGSMTPRESRNTAVGAGVGALGGALISGGDLGTTVGGAVVGGVIGNVVTDDRNRR
jgi:osmotically inducible lipoprotein OsmB